MKQEKYFSDWATDIFERNKQQFSFIAVRNKKVLNILYPEDKKNFIKLSFSMGEAVIGWVVLLNTQMTNHHYFGNMKVGSIIDCLCDEGYEHEIMNKVKSFLIKNGADMIVTNQSFTSQDQEHLRAPAPLFPAPRAGAAAGPGRGGSRSRGRCRRRSRAATWPACSTRCAD